MRWGSSAAAASRAAASWRFSSDAMRTVFSAAGGGYCGWAAAGVASAFKAMHERCYQRALPVFDLNWHSACSLVHKVTCSMLLSSTAGVFNCSF